MAVLVYLDELTEEQAADTLGISRKTVGERLKRFREHARKRIGRWEATP